MFISVIGVQGRPPLFLSSSASFRFFKNVEYHLCTVDLAINSDPYALLDNLIICTANLRRQMQNLMLTHHPQNS